MKNKMEPLLVTTEHRGVFFGYGTPTESDIITLQRARMAVRWSPNMRGVLGLAVLGPDKDCRIGPAVESITLQGVTACIKVNDAASRKWEEQPWS